MFCEYVIRIISEWNGGNMDDIVMDSFLYMYNEFKSLCLSIKWKFSY